MIRVLAEAITFTEEEILVILLVLVGILVVGVVVVVLGCIWAWMAGKGSVLALVGFLVIASLEAPLLLASIPGLVTDLNLAVLGPLAVLGLQVALYLGGRASAGRSA